LGKSRDWLLASLTGLVDREVCGSPENSERRQETVVVADHGEANHRVLGWLDSSEVCEPNDLGGVGHRVVHGGYRFAEPTPITNEVIGAIEDISQLAPLHNGPSLSNPSVEATSLYDKLEHVILPMFYRRQNDFAEIMRSAIAVNGSFFNAQRMVSQYMHNAYSVIERG
jgi:acetate kinase